MKFLHIKGGAIMNINPLKWHWTQWLATITFIIYCRTLFIVEPLLATGTDFISSVAVAKVFSQFLPTVVAIIVFIATIIPQLYVYGFYVDVTLEYIMIRVGISGGILGVAYFIFFVFSMPLKMVFVWKGALLLIGLFLLYGLSMFLCYQFVEFRLVDESDLLKLKEELEQQADSMEEDDDYAFDDKPKRNSKRRRR